jgi:hypothetical protein
VDAHYYNGSDDRDIHGGGMGHHVSYRYACQGLLEAVKKACIPAEWHGDDQFNQASAVWFARHVAREARRLGLLPSEPLDVQVVARIDVEAGEPIGP